MTKIQQYWSRVASLGCIACRIDGIHNDYVSIHHVEGRTKPDAHFKVLPLCAEHHQTGGKEKPSIHPWKARFERKYGTQAELMKMVDELLEADMRITAAHWATDTRVTIISNGDWPKN